MGTGVNDTVLLLVFPSGIGIGVKAFAAPNE